MKKLKTTTLILTSALTILAAAPTYAQYVQAPASGMAPQNQAMQPQYQSMHRQPAAEDPRLQNYGGRTDTSGMPQPIQAGDARYITGGIGDEERAMLESEKNQYNVHITSSNVNGEFNGDTSITIMDSSGRVLVNADAGPLFYAELPRGKYTIQATNNGQTKTQHVSIGGEKTSRVYFRW